jgi:hypothetical protein
MAIQAIIAGIIFNDDHVAELVVKSGIHHYAGCGGRNGRARWRRKVLTRMEFAGYFCEGIGPAAIG